MRSPLLAVSVGEIRSARGAEMLRKGMCRASVAEGVTLLLLVVAVLESDVVFLWDSDDGVHGLVVKNPDVTVVAA